MNKLTGRTVLRSNDYVWLKLTVLLEGETTQLGKVLLAPVHPAMGTVTVYAAHLPAWQTKTKESSAVGSVRVEGEELMAWSIDSYGSIIPIRATLRCMAYSLRSKRIAHGDTGIAAATKVIHPTGGESDDGNEHKEHLTVVLTQIEQLP